MKFHFNFHDCKKRILFAPAVNKVPILLQRNIKKLARNSSGEALFPSTLAFAGSLAILFGLRYVKARFFSNENPAVCQQRVTEAEEQRALESDISTDSNGCSVTSTASPGEERDQSVWQILTPKVRTVPGLSAILHSQVFGSSNLRCITKLNGVDVAPKNARSLRRASEHVYSHGRKSRKNKTQEKKDIPLQMSASSTKTEGRTSESLATENGAERKLRNRTSHDVVSPINTQSGAPTNQKQVTGNADTPNLSSGDFQGQAPDSMVKKPRNSLIRKPRLRHRNKAQISAQHTAPQSESCPCPDHCGDDHQSVECEVPESDAAQKGVPGLSRLNESARNSGKKKHRPRKKSSIFESEKPHPGRAGHQPCDPRTERDIKEGNKSAYSRKGVSVRESKLSRANKPFQNTLSSENDKHGRALCEFTFQDVRSGDDARPTSARQLLKDTFSGDNPTQCERLRAPEKSSRQMQRKYHSQRRYLALDEPQSGEYMEHTQAGGVARKN